MTKNIAEIEENQGEKRTLPERNTMKRKATCP